MFRLTSTEMYRPTLGPASLSQLLVAAQLPKKSLYNVGIDIDIYI